MGSQFAHSPGVTPKIVIGAYYLRKKEGVEVIMQFSHQHQKQIIVSQ